MSGSRRSRLTRSVRFAPRAATRTTGPRSKPMPRQWRGGAPFGGGAGALGGVVEGVAEPLGRRITEQVAIPTIGIGASAACDGQILVLEDMLGLSARVPKFVKRYGNLGPSIEKAVADSAAEVRSRAFPGVDQVYGMKAKEP